MKHLFLFSCLLALLAGCTNYAKVMDSWVGSSEAELIEVWGEPDSVVERGGNKVLTYEKYWADMSGVQNRGRMKFNVDPDGTIVSWQKTNFPDRIYGRPDDSLAR